MISSGCRNRSKVPSWETGVRDPSTQAAFESAPACRQGAAASEGFAGGRRRLSGAGRKEAPPPGAPVCVAGSAAESDSTMRGPKTGQSGGVVALTLGNHLEA